VPGEAKLTSSGAKGPRHWALILADVSAARDFSERVPERGNYNAGTTATGQGAWCSGGPAHLPVTHRIDYRGPGCRQDEQEGAAGLGEQPPPFEPAVGEVRCCPVTGPPVQRHRGAPCRVAVHHAPGVPRDLAISLALVLCSRVASTGISRRLNSQPNAGSVAQ
jgi:hypothetical protein